MQIRTIERRPQHADGNTKPPLLVLLHGYGSNEHDLMGLAPYLDPRFHIISVRAILELGPGAYAWYHLYGTLGNLIPDEATRAQSLEVVTKLMAELPEQAGADPEQVYLFGFSQGAVMSTSVMLTAPHLISGVAAFSGYLDDKIVPQIVPDQVQGKPLLMTHGTADEVISVSAARKSREVLETLPIDFTYEEYPTGHNIHPNALLLAQEWFKARLGPAEDSA
jgi:phospholipase/carboxylesterase